MPFSRWLTLSAWSLFSLIALIPILYLVAMGWADTAVFPNGAAFPWRLLGNSAAIAVSSSALAVLAGVPYAWLCTCTDLWNSRLWRVAGLIPLLIPPYLHAMAWQRASTDLGGLFGNAGSPLSITLHSEVGVVLVLSCAYFPLVVLLTLGGLSSLDSSAEEAARMQQGIWQTSTRITLPLILPYLLTGAMLVFLFALLEFGVPDLLRVRVYTVEIFVQFSALYDPIGAVHLAMPLLLITLAAVALQVRLMRGRRYWCLHLRGPGVYRYRLGAWQLPALAFVGAIVALSVLLPITMLVLQARWTINVLTTLTTMSETLLFSIAVAATAALLMVILSFGIAHQLVRATGLQRLLLEYLIHLPLAVPPILLGVALIQVWNRPATDWLYGSSLIVVFGYITRFIPFTVRVLAAYGEQIHPHLEESAMLLARPSQVLQRISLPLLAPGLRAAFAIAFVFALGELGVTLLVIPPGKSTIPITLYNYLHYGAEPIVALLSLILLGLQLVVILSVSPALWGERELRGLA